VLVTQMDVFQRLLGTVEIDTVQFLCATVPAIGLLVVWELGKLAARMLTHAPGPLPVS
jgi:Ca2+-transporting ATPase